MFLPRQFELSARKLEIRLFQFDLLSFNGDLKTAIARLSEIKLRIDETSKRYEFWLTTHCVIAIVQVAVDVMLWMNITEDGNIFGHRVSCFLFYTNEKSTPITVNPYLQVTEILYSAIATFQAVFPLYIAGRCLSDEKAKFTSFLNNDLPIVLDFDQAQGLVTVENNAEHDQNDGAEFSDIMTSGRLSQSLSLAARPTEAPARGLTKADSLRRRSKRGGSRGSAALGFAENTTAGVVGNPEFGQFSVENPGRISDPSLAEPFATQGSRDLKPVLFNDLGSLGMFIGFVERCEMALTIFGMPITPFWTIVGSAPSVLYWVLSGGSS